MIQKEGNDQTYPRMMLRQLVATEEGQVTVSIAPDTFGIGELPQKGDSIMTHYTGMLTTGKIFDSSMNQGAPFLFQVGVGHVIECWDDAFMQLKASQRAQIICPPEKAYGN